MKQNGRLIQAFSHFMTGRYGMDPLGRFLSGGSAALLLLSLFTRRLGGGRISAAFSYLALLALAFCYYRCFSRRVEVRRAENDRFLALESRLAPRSRRQWELLRQRKDYVFFRCPGCKELIRVPRHKGRLRITCRRCGYTFEKKT